MFRFIKKYKNNIGTIVAEIFIVFVGISISMNIDNWREAKENRTKERAYIQDLYYDITDDLVRMNERINHISSGRTRIAVLFTAMHFPDSIQITQKEFKFIMGRSLQLETFETCNYTFLDISSTGNTKLIKNAQIRKLMYMYYGKVKLLNDMEDINNKSCSEIVANDLLKIFPYRELFNASGVFNANGVFDGIEHLQETDLSFFRSPYSEKYIHLENAMLTRARQFSDESKAISQTADPGLELRKLLGQCLKLPDEEEFVKELIKKNLRAKDLLKQYQEKFPEYILLEVLINKEIYKIIDTHPKVALDLALLNTETYPDSPNVFDSLGDCFIANQDKENALKNYKLAYEMDPILFETRSKIEKLELEWKK